MSFYEALMIAMRQKGMKPAQLCERAGIYQSYISRLKSGKIKSVEWDKALAIIEALDMTPNDFLAIQRSDQS